MKTRHPVPSCLFCHLSISLDAVLILEEKVTWSLVCLLTFSPPTLNDRYMLLLYIQIFVSPLPRPIALFVPPPSPLLLLLVLLFLLYSPLLQFSLLPPLLPLLFPPHFRSLHPSHSLLYTCKFKFQSRVYI